LALLSPAKASLRFSLVAMKRPPFDPKND